MNEEPPPSDDPKPEPSSIPKFVWVLVALSPSALIMFVMGSAFHDHANAQQDLSALLIIDLVLSIVGSVQLLKSPSRGTATVVIGAFFLGIFFAVLNAGIGLLAGCALGIK